MAAPRFVEIVVARQRWRLTLRGDGGPAWWPVRVERVGLDFRPFRAGEDGKPTARRVGRRRLTVRLRADTGRLAFDSESALFERRDRAKIAAAALRLL